MRKMSLRADFLVGLTTILALAGLATILILFGEIDLTQPDTYPITLQLDEATGLERGSAVTLNGVPVGRLEQLENATDPFDGVVAQLQVQQHVQIPNAVEVRITSDLVGNTTLALVTLTTGEGPPGMIQPGGTLRADAKDIIDRIAGVLDQRFNGVSDSLSNLGQTADAVTNLADTYTRVGEKIELMLDPDNADPDANTTDTANVFRTVTKIERAVDNANAWLDQPQLREDLNHTVADARSTFERVQTAANTFRDAAQNISARADGLAENADNALNAFIDSARNLDLALNEAQQLVAAINQGEGTAGRIAKNPDLYRNINDASVRLEAMLREFELLLRQYRTEGIDLDL